MDGARLPSSVNGNMKNNDLDYVPLSFPDSSVYDYLRMFQDNFQCLLWIMPHNLFQRRLVRCALPEIQTPLKPLSLHQRQPIGTSPGDHSMGEITACINLTRVEPMLWASISSIIIVAEVARHPVNNLYALSGVDTIG